MRTASRLSGIAEWLGPIVSGLQWPPAAMFISLIRRNHGDAGPMIAPTGVSATTSHGRRCVDPKPGRILRPPTVAESAGRPDLAITPRKDVSAAACARSVDAARVIAPPGDGKSPGASQTLRQAKAAVLAKVPVLGCDGLPSGCLACWPDRVLPVSGVGRMAL